MIIKRSQVSLYVMEKVIKSFEGTESIPSKLEIQSKIVDVVDGVEVLIKTKWDPELKKEIAVTTPLEQYFAKLSLAEIKAIQEEIQKNIAKVKFPKIKENGKFSNLLKELKSLAWNIQASDIPDFVQAILRMKNFMEREEELEPGKYEEAIYLKGEVEGGGKSTLLNAITRGFSEGGYRVSEGQWPTKFSNVIPFANSNLVVIPDCDPQKRKEVSEEKMKHILRKEYVENEIKGLSPVQVKVESALIAAGNCEPPFTKDRCWKVFDVIPVDFKGSFKDTQTGKQIIEDTKARFGSVDNVSLPSLYVKYVNYGFYDLISKFKENLKSENLKPDHKSEETGWLPIRLQKRLKSLPSILEVLHKMENAPVNFSKISAKEIVDFSQVLPEHEQLDMWVVISTLKTLASNEIILSYNPQPNAMYTKYDLKGMETKVLEYVGEDEVAHSTEDMVKESLAMWDKLIKFFEDFENDPENKFLKGDEDAKLDDSWTVLNINDREGEYNKNGDQVCVNKPLDPNHPNRKNAGVHKQNYLFECDNISVKEQVEMVENAPKELKDSIYWVCYTGGKSIHTIIKTNTPDSASSELRKYIHQKLNEKYFGGNADPSGQNAGRLARAPNAIRQDNKHPGEKQICLYFNHEEPIALDVSSLVSDFEEEQRLSKSLKEQVEGFENNDKKPRNEEGIQVNTLSELKKWNEKKPSKAKEECIAFLEGRLNDWNRGIACVRELRNFGFSDFDIENEGMYDDTWIKQAIKGAK